MSKSKILFQISGSIAAYKACSVVSKLVSQGHEVQTVVTENALKFVGKATLEGLTGRVPLVNGFETGSVMDHIHLTKWADVAVLCPASANIINSLAQGLAHDLIGMIFLSWPKSKKYLVYPAMNTNMWEHPKVIGSVSILKSWGIQVNEPDAGRLACGDVGLGKLQEPTLIASEIIHSIAKSRLSQARKVLITSGPTSESLDPVRVLTNRSRGSTGATVAQYFYQQGWDVTLLYGEGSILPEEPMDRRSFFSGDDLERSLTKELESGWFDAAIHMAAVSDYQVENIKSDHTTFERHKKIPTQSELHVILRERSKILSKIKIASMNPNVAVVGFKLTTDENLVNQVTQVQRLFEQSQVDFVVHNDLLQDPSFFQTTHPFTIFASHGAVTKGQTKQELAQSLCEILSRWQDNLEEKNPPSNPILTAVPNDPMP